MTSIKTLALTSVLGATLFAPAKAHPVSSTPAVGVGPQYDLLTHVYMAEADLAAFATSFTATLEDTPARRRR